jgi:hypothetical protein
VETTPPDIADTHKTETQKIRIRFIVQCWLKTQQECNLYISSSCTRRTKYEKIPASFQMADLLRWGLS